MPGIKKIQLVEIVVKGVSGGGNQQLKIQIPDQPYLRNVQTWAIEAFCSADCTTSPSQITPVSLANLKIAYLTLYVNDIDNPNDVGEWIQLIPLIRFHNMQGNAADQYFARFPMLLAGQKIYWEKCYITLATPLANTADVSFLLSVQFSGSAITGGK